MDDFFPFIYNQEEDNFEPTYLYIEIEDNEYFIEQEELPSEEYQSIILDIT